ncbi:MAG: pyridoxal 5'-phosphate synthase glutaminase subunit PdxT [Spirochaetota bacterium]
MKIGVLALQGAVQDHERVLGRLGVETVQVRHPADLEGLQGLILPGGESSVMAMYLQEYGLDIAIRSMVTVGMPIFGVCAGAILLCREVEGPEGAVPGALALLGARAIRNAYGRQLSSFEEPVDTEGGPFPGIYIRAPRFMPIGSTEVLGRRPASAGGGPVLLRQAAILAASFHPELSGNDGIHRLFLEACRSWSNP